MKKRKNSLYAFFLAFSMLFTSNVYGDGIDVYLQCGGFDGTFNNPYPKSPIQPPQVEQDGYTLAFVGAHADYMLCLLDENDDVVYNTFVPSSVSTVVLPGYLQGTYEIRLLTDTVYFYGLITL